MDDQLKPIKLKADIELATRELRRLQADIDNLATTKKYAFKEFEEQKKDRQKTIDHLQAEGVRLQKLCHMYSSAFTDLEEVIQLAYKEKETVEKEAKEAVIAIHEEVEKRIRAVSDREVNVSKREQLNDQREQAASKKELALTRLITENDNKIEELIRQGKELDSRTETVNKSLAKAQDLLDDITRQLEQKRMQVQVLDKQIEDKTRIAETTGKNAEERLQSVTLRESIVAGREKMVNERTIEQNKREVRLNDKSATIRRGLDELLQKRRALN